MTITPIRTTTPIPMSVIRIYDYEPDPPNPLEEWIELINYDNETIDMTDRRVRYEAGNKHYFPNNYKLSASARVKLWTGSGTNHSSNLYWEHSEEVWNDRGDCIYLHLLDEHNNYVRVDAQCYGLYSSFQP